MPLCAQRPLAQHQMLQSRLTRSQRTCHHCALTSPHHMKPQPGLITWQGDQMMRFRFPNAATFPKGSQMCQENSTHIPQCEPFSVTDKSPSDNCSWGQTRRQIRFALTHQFSLTKKKVGCRHHKRKLQSREKYCLPPPVGHIQVASYFFQIAVARYFLPGSQGLRSQLLQTAS